MVELTIGQRSLIGLATGVDAQGGITLLIDGKSQTFYGCEISMRKKIV